jgi:hypothetical protein
MVQEVEDLKKAKPTKSSTTRWLKMFDKSARGILSFISYYFFYAR